jgi:hypothetical protein
MKDLNEKVLRKRVKGLLIFFIIALAISGITAFPLETELAFVVSIIPSESILFHWIDKVYSALKTTNQQFPFIAYGTDWLAFAHLVIAINFFGPLKDPVKNIWVLHFGVIACLCIIPLAFIAGDIREIPIYWRLIDCSFGIFGLLPLLLCIKYIRRLESLEKTRYTQYAGTTLQEVKIFEL